MTKTLSDEWLCVISCQVQKLQEENAALRVQLGTPDMDDSVFSPSPVYNNGHIYSNSELLQGKYVAEQVKTKHDCFFSELLRYSIPMVSESWTK